MALSRRRALRWVTGAAAIAWMMVIFSASAQTGSDSGGMSRTVADGLLSAWSALTGASFEGAARDAAIEALQLPIRKGAHMAEYALLAVLAFAHLLTYRPWARPETAPALSTERPADSAEASASTLRERAGVLGKPAALAWAFATLYAATDEFHQLFVPARAGMVTDVLVDSAGALVGVLLAWLVLRVLRRRPR